MAGEQTTHHKRVRWRDTMKTLIAAVAFAAVFAAPAFAQSVHAWGWKGALDAPGSAKSADAASFDGRRGALSGRRGTQTMHSKIQTTLAVHALRALLGL